MIPYGIFRNYISTTPTPGPLHVLVIIAKETHSRFTLCSIFYVNRQSYYRCIIKSRFCFISSVITRLCLSWKDISAIGQLHKIGTKNNKSNVCNVWCSRFSITLQTGLEAAWPCFTTRRPYSNKTTKRFYACNLLKVSRRPKLILS